jgi:ribosomal protein S12 methylthiotransferase
MPILIFWKSLIVGFPGETKADFEELLNFVEEARFDRLGVFKYSEEEGTAAAEFDGKVTEAEKENRWQELMEVQAEISRKKNQALIGTTARVMIDGTDRDTGKLAGRTQAHAPEVDGFVYVEGCDAQRRGNLPRSGELIDVKITGALEYDLISEILDG